ncbi:S41 family peptidase [Sporosarcina saromensis]|uniref:S41 family peptidase n=1 Tax=Sporosarcina saromensis TaxID=359365 RepID=A0ABU4G587_9BACL|nr:S41 family peptidase [Sporosarcina saromensis]MDW0111557.1 S41 family peptidase [Sporosarcina saromensis]
MTRYMEIFKEIVDIVHHDYAGYDEKQGWDEPAHYFGEIERLISGKQITPRVFTDLVSEYLMAFQDRHMSFNLKGADDVKRSTRGFRIRRYEDALYVVETCVEERFPVGSKIISIDQQEIEMIITSDRSYLRETSAEREDWTHLLNKSSSIEIEDDNGERLTFDLKNYEPIFKKLAPSLEEVDGETLQLTLPSFANVDETLDFVKNHEEKLKACTNLIIDVRNNHGGNGKSFSNLLPYIFPPDEHPSTGGELKEFNYTNRNSELFIQLCQQLRKDITDVETLKFFDSIEEECEKYRGQGFVTMDFSDELETEALEFEGTDSPKNVIVMTDVYCASAAEYFVEICMESSKTTVIGRATMGINDYSDLLIKEWDGIYALYYPMSRRIHKTSNDPLHGKGIRPDRYIPWTPKHIDEDLDLLYAMSMLRECKIAEG